MRERKLIQYEIRQLLWKKTVWCVLGVVLLLPVINVTGLLGRTSLNLFHSMQQGSVTDTYILYPIFNSLTIGCLAVSILVAYEMDWPRRSNALSILESTENRQKHLLRKTGAAAIVICGAAALLILVLWPYTALKMGGIFSGKAYFFSWIYLYLGGLLISILLTAGLYQISRGSVVSSVFAFTVILTVLPMVQQLIDMSAYDIWTAIFTPQKVAVLSWLQTPVERLSDGTGNGMQFRIMAYYRGIWLLFSAAVLMLGTLMYRRKGQNRMRTVPLLVLVGAVFAARLMINNQPFYYNGTLVNTDYIEQTDTRIDLSPIEIDHSIHVPGGSIEAMVDGTTLTFHAQGKYDVVIDNPGGQFRWAFYIPAGMEVISVTQDGEPVAFAQAGKPTYSRNQIFYHIELDRKAEFTLEITYGGIPKNGFDHPMHMITKDYVDIKRWAPEFYGAMSTDQLIHVTLTLPEALKPNAPDCSMQEIECQLENYHSYQFVTFTLETGNLIAGKYHTAEFQSEGTTIQLMYFSNKEKWIQESDLLSILQKTVSFFQKTFGTPRIINRDGSKTLFFVERTTNPEGLSSEGLNTIYLPESQLWELDEYGRIQIEDGMNLTQAVELLARRWWRGYIREGKYLHDPWTTDGMVKYCTYVFMRRYVGEEFAQREFVDQWIAEKNHAVNAFYAANPDYLSKLPTSMQEEFMEDQMKNLMRDYSHLVLLKAEELVGGEEAFLAKLKELRSEKNNSYERFLEVMGLTKDQLTLD